LKTKEDILKNQPLTSLTEVNGYRQLFGNCLVTNSLQNIFFCVQQKK